LASDCYDLTYQFLPNLLPDCRFEPIIIVPQIIVTRVSDLAGVPVHGLYGPLAGAGNFTCFSVFIAVNNTM